jgi:hypothetical protein
MCKAAEFHQHCRTKTEGYSTASAKFIYGPL